jgi:hypothetical protein
LAVLRLAVVRFAAGFLAVDFLAAGAFAAEERVEPALADLAREVLVFLAAGFARALLAAGFRRVAVALRAPLALRDEDEDPPALLLEPDDPLSDHLPVITRCAASATASAISEPNLVALATMLLAALEAVSAASRPASRIARRALGLALIAAAAAAKPAASISLLIAALASLSTELSFELEEDRDELFRAFLAIVSSPSSRTKTL